MRTLPALTDRDASMRDHAGKGGYSLAALEDRISDCQNQPDFRARADRAHAFYDMGKQLTPEREHKIRRDWGIEPRQTNLIHGVINGVLGQEAKARSDVRVEADDDEFADVSDVMSSRMKEAQREANIDMAVSNAYGSQVKGGLGWVEVSRASDPLDYPYRVRDIHRNEIWYDWRALDVGLTDATWMVRKRWQDLDEAVALMPQFREILEQSINGWDMLNLPDDDTTLLRSAYNNQRQTTIRRDEWADSARKRIKFFEVWYRVPAEVVVLHMSPTRRTVYDKANPLHVEAVSRGKVKISKSITRQVRMALFAGPHRLVDTATTRRNFPYVPFFAFRDDEDRSPYGMIEGMISPQEEFNERRQMFNWMLLARQLVIDNDALDMSKNTFKDIERSMMRPDLMVVLNGNRQNKAGGFKLGNDLQFQREQFMAMQDAKQLVQEVPKIFGPQLGDAPTGVTSGVAMNTLVEQGIVGMGEMDDNYRFGRKMVHEEVLNLIAEDHQDEEMQVVLGQGSTRRVVVLNTWSPEGAPMNRVKDAPMKVGLSDVPSSPAFRMQEQQQLGSIITALQGNPAAMNILAPAYIEGSSLNNRQPLADDLRRATGMPVAGDRQAQQAAEQQAQQMAQKQRQLQEADAQTKIEKTVAETRLLNARAEDHEDSGYIGMRQQALTEMQPPDPAANEDRLVQEAMREAAQG